MKKKTATKKRQYRIIIIDNKPEVFCNEGIINITLRAREDDIIRVNEDPITNEGLRKALQLSDDIRIVSWVKEWTSGEIRVKISGRCLPRVRFGDTLPTYYPVKIGKYILWPFKRYKEI